MSEEQKAVQDKIGAMKAQLSAVEQVKELFALAHDLIIQASYPGHLAGKVQAATNFLMFQHKDFTTRAETMKKSLESMVDVPAAKEAVEAALNGNAQAPSGNQTQSSDTPNE